MGAERLRQDGPIIPRPERTPEALKEAVAQVAAHRLPEMEKEKNEVLAEAIEQNSLGPINLFLLRWAVVVEIERFPETARRLHRAERVAVESEDPDVSRRAVTEVGDIIRATYTELGA